MRLRNLFEFRIICRKLEICISDRLEMAKKRKSLLMFRKTKMNDTLNISISIKRLLLLNLQFLQYFFCYMILRQKYKISTLQGIRNSLLKAECHIVLLLSNLATTNRFFRENRV